MQVMTMNNILKLTMKDIPFRNTQQMGVVLTGGNEMTEANRISKFQMLYPFSSNFDKILNYREYAPLLEFASCAARSWHSFYDSTSVLTKMKG